jgi:hypothetical protein
VLFAIIFLKMTPLEKTPTLRQLAASALRIVGPASVLRRAECAYTNELQRLGLAARGRRGRGGTQPGKIEHAEVLTLAMALGIPAKQAVAGALALRTLPVENSTRWFSTGRKAADSGLELLT